MRVKGIVFLLNPVSKLFEKHKGTRPFAKPDELFFHGAIDALDAFFVDGDFLNTPEDVGDPSVAPVGVLGFDLSDGHQEVLIAQIDFLG